MRLYALLARLFPRSFAAKVFLIAFVGTHVPLIATVFFMFSNRGGLMANLDIAAVILVATLAGTAATLWSLRTILAPLFMVRDAMVAFEARGARTALPTGYRDEVGTLMAMTDRLVLHVDHRLKRTREAADTDPLTGLLNRRGFDRIVDGHGAGALVYLDLDHFKSVNDAFGHQAGDDVLRDTARALRGAVRDGDVLARFGGEEFVVFLPEADAAEARDVAERARAALEADVAIGDRRVTASFGVALRAPELALARAMERADAAAYDAKQAGRNRVTMWSEGMAAAA